MSKKPKKQKPVEQIEMSDDLAEKPLFLREGLDIQEEETEVYDLQKEFAASKKNRSTPVHTAIASFSALLLGATIWLTYGIQKDIDRTSVGIADFRDINLQELVNALRAAKFELDKIDDKISLIRRSMEMEIERIRHQSDLEIQKVEQSGLSQAKKEVDEKKVREARATLRQWLNIESDWTDPTDVISVPRDSRLLAVSVQPPSRVADQPRGNVMVVSWVKDQGIEAFREESVQRGKVANFSARFPETKKPRTKKSPGGASGRLHGTGMEEMYLQTTSGFPETADTSTLVNYLTDTLVLDMHGGERLPGNDRLNRPGAILVMDPDGALAVRHELDDLVECTEIKESFTPKQPGGAYDYPDYEMDGLNYDGYQPHGFEGLRGRGEPSRLPPRGGRGP